MFEVELLEFEREDLTDDKDGGVLREVIEQGTGYATPKEGSELKGTITILLKNCTLF